MASRRRESKAKKINPTLFVFCEGETEVAYINLLKSLYRIPSIHIHPKIGGSDITAEYIVNYKRDKPTHEKDSDYLFYDLDVEAIFQRLNQIRNCTLLVSNPSIELWFLLHYKNQTANINSASCCRELQNRNRSYKKGLIDNRLKDKLISRKSEAIRRGKGLVSTNNPSTTVYRLLEKLDEIKDSL